MRILSLDIAAKSALLIGVCHLAFETASAQEFKSLPARRAVENYEDRLAKLDKKHSDGIASLQESYAEEAESITDTLVKALKIAQKKATVAEEFEEALALQTAIKAYSDMEFVAPADSTKSTGEPSNEVERLRAEATRLERENARLRRWQRPQAEQDRQRMQAALSGTRWEWNSSKLVYHFGDGVCWISDLPQKKSQWRAVSRYAVEIDETDGTKSQITFNDQYTHFLKVHSTYYRSAKLIGRDGQ